MAEVMGVRATNSKAEDVLGLACHIGMEICCVRKMQNLKDRGLHARS